MRRERTEGKDVYECSNCNTEQDPTYFDADLIDAANRHLNATDNPIRYIEEIVPPPRWAVDLAADDFTGNTLCADCWWDLVSAAWAIAGERER